MFGQLLESRSIRQRRTGGAALSIAAHLAVISAAAVATASGSGVGRENQTKVVVIHYQPPPQPAPPPEVQHVAQVTDAIPAAPTIAMPRQIQVPTIVPTSLPPVNLAQGSASDTVVFVLSGGSHAARQGAVLDLNTSDAPSSGAWTANELMMRMVSSAKPRYPESLRQAGIDGRVLVRFTVDTLGRVDMKTLQILQSTHDLFTRAVRDVLSSYRFKPAEIRGKPVTSMAEMPFEFSIAR
jgi:periplasmic protein TonB